MDTKRNVKDERKGKLKGEKKRADKADLRIKKVATVAKKRAREENGKKKKKKRTFEGGATRVEEDLLGHGHKEMERNKMTACVRRLEEKNS